MILLMIKEYSMNEKITLYGALSVASATIRNVCGYEQPLKDIDRAIAWLEKQIEKEETGNAQNR